MNVYGHDIPDTQNGRRVLFEPALYVFDKSLAGSAESREQILAFEVDCEVVVVALAGSSTGAYQIELKDARGKGITSGPLRNANIIGTAQFPAALPAPLVIPPRGTLTLSLKDLSTATNAIQIVAIAVRRHVL